MQADRRGDPMMIGWWILFALIIGTVAFIRIRLLAIPLERDEGEYGYAGQLMLHGIVPYKLAYNMKFPGTYAAYALGMALFGQTPTGIHLTLLIVNLGAIALLFAIALRLVTTVGALVAAGSYAVLSISPSVLGLAAHAVHFVLLPTLGATLLLLDKRPTTPGSRIFMSGFLFGIGVLMKQPAIFFLLFGGCYLLYRDIFGGVSWRGLTTRAAIFSCGGVLPLALTFLGLWIAGVFPKFWFWTVTYARAYGSIVPLREGILIAADKTQKTLGPLWPCCGLALLGLAALFYRSAARKHAVFVMLFLLGPIAALCSGFYFREHYYVFLFPSLSILAGFTIGTLVEACWKWRWIVHTVSIIVVATALAYPFVNQANMFFAPSPEEACTRIYRGNIFQAAPRIAAYVRDHTSPDDTIAVIGSEPEIYFYSHRHSATGYIYTYALMEEHRYVPMMQKEMEREIDLARPQFLIFISVPTSWFIASWSDLSIVYWANNYSLQNYHATGFVNILKNGAADYCVPCGGEIGPWPPSVLIVKRNP